MVIPGIEVYVTVENRIAIKQHGAEDFEYVVIDPVLVTALIEGIQEAAEEIRAAQQEAQPGE